MNLEQGIDEVAANYIRRGYNVTKRPKPDDLPPFARDFKIELVGRLRDVGALVSIKRNRDEFSADGEQKRYAEITASQPGWRFDFVLLEGEGIRREVNGAQEPSDREVDEMLALCEHLLSMKVTPSALVAGWAAFEAAMRRRLRSEGETAGWGTAPREMMNELVSNGTFSMDEYSQLEIVSRLRNEIVHGFAARSIDPMTVDFVIATTRRLMNESRAMESAM
jgi:hypothetical protein